MSKQEFHDSLINWITLVMIDSQDKISHPLFKAAMQKPGEDILGEWFIKNIKYSDREKKGQIFTPVYICDYINANCISLLKKHKTTEELTFMDPCCGSGRFIMDLIKKGYKKYILGVDIDRICVFMSVLNVYFMKPDLIKIIWGNTLTDQAWEEYVISNSKIIRNVIQTI